MFDVVDAALEQARVQGVKDVEVYAERTSSRRIKVYKQEVEQLTAAQRRGVGVRVFRDGAVGHAYTSDLGAESLGEVVRRAAANAAVSDPDEFAALPQSGRRAGRRAARTTSDSRRPPTSGASSWRSPWRPPPWPPTPVSRRSRRACTPTARARSSSPAAPACAAASAPTSATASPTLSPSRTARSRRATRSRSAGRSRIWTRPAAAARPPSAPCGCSAPGPARRSRARCCSTRSWRRRSSACSARRSRPTPCRRAVRSSPAVRARRWPVSSSIWSTTARSPTAWTARRSTARGCPRGARRSSATAACCRASCTTRTRRARPAAESTGNGLRGSYAGLPGVHPTNLVVERSRTTPVADILAGVDRGVLVTDAVGRALGRQPRLGRVLRGHRRHPHRGRTAHHPGARGHAGERHHQHAHQREGPGRRRPLGAGRQLLTPSVLMDGMAISGI